MALRIAQSWRTLGLVALAGAVLAACTLSETPAKKRKRTPVDPGDDFYDDETSAASPIAPDGVNEQSDAFGASERPAPDAGKGAAKSDAGPADPETDAGLTKTFCAPAPRPGDLAVVELMISSRAGSGDSGEWVEVRNTQTCWLHLNGVSVESPRGAASSNVATFATDVELEPGGTFVVAGSTDVEKNHGLSGTVLGWNSTDVLKNDGDTVSVRLGDLELDRVTFPSFNNLTAGRSLAFPADCPAAQRSDWKRWSLAFATFSAGFQGTPNAPNDDITCF